MPRPMPDPGARARRRLDAEAERRRLEALTVDELRDHAAELGIVGRSTMRKAELIAAIQQR